VGNASGVYELSNRPLIRAIQHHISKRNGYIEKRCINKPGFGDHFSFGTGALECGSSGSDFELTDIGGTKQGLPRKIGGIYLVAIKPVQPANPACREIEGGGAAETACTNQKNACSLECSNTFVIDAIE
jgi:hypothetical protein